MAYNPYQGRTFYRDMKDNLTKINFEVWVTESYNPNIHPSLLKEGAPPPIYDVSDLNRNDWCKSMLPASYIIDALVTGQPIDFVHMEDIPFVKNMIQKYLEQLEGVNLSKDPQTLAFKKRAERAINMIGVNMKRRDDDEQRAHPHKLSIEAILRGL